MDETFLQSLTWIGIAGGVVAVFLILELLFRTLINRFGTPLSAHSYRSGGRLPQPR